MDEQKVITLCGSTRFKDEFLLALKTFTLQGYIVLMPGVFGHAGDNEALDQATKTMLDELHKRKIDLSNEIFVINKDNYIGESTESEIQYAKAQNKVIRYLE